MTNIVVASFKEESQAVAAATKLHELESIGDIIVYESVIVKKDASGQVEMVKTRTSEGLATASGMAVGTLVGALAGPVGMVAGMLTGTLTGAAIEVDNYSFAGDFGSRVVDKMQSDSAAVIAEVDEDSAIFIDGTLAPLGGVIYRSDVDYEYEKYDNEQIEALEKEIDDQRAKLSEAAENAKQKIRNKIEELKQRRREKIAELENKSKKLMEKGKTKMQTMGDDMKQSMIDYRISRLRKRIERHESILSELRSELKQMEVKA